MTYSGEREVIGYDGGQYRGGQEMVRTARVILDSLNLSDVSHQRALGVFSNGIVAMRQVCEAYYHLLQQGEGDQARTTLRVAYNSLLTLADNQLTQNQLSQTLFYATDGVRRAAIAVHTPITSPEHYTLMFEQRRVIGSPGDFQTDSNGYETLERFMEPDFASSPTVNS